MMAYVLVGLLVCVGVWGFVALGSYINPLTGRREWWK